MTSSLKRENVTVGEIYFHATVTAEEVHQFADDLRGGMDGHRFKRMYIRPKDHPRLVLGFEYDVGTDDEKDYEKFYFKITDITQRRFPNRVGWSISGPVDYFV